MSQPCLKFQPLYPPDSPFPFATCRDLSTPHVHFPPSPILTSTHTTHSPTVYDRAPIAVSPNLCALPERGGRVYTSKAQRPALTTLPGDYFHPRAFESSERLDVPFLIPDLSSSESSDDNDGIPNSPSDSPPQVPPISRHFTTNPPSPLVHRSHSQEEIDNALSFLPHPPYSAKEEARRRSRCPSRHRSGSHELHRATTKASAFEIPSLDDGCLGGF